MIKFCKLSENIIALINEGKLYKVILRKSTKSGICSKCIYNKLEEEDVDNRTCIELLHGDINLEYNSNDCLTTLFENYIYYSINTCIERRASKLRLSLLLSLYISKQKIFSVEI